MSRSAVGTATAPRSRAIPLRLREFLLLLAVGDAAVALIAMLAVVSLWSRSPGFVPTEAFEVWLVGTWLLWLVALRMGGAYDLLAPDVRGRISGALARALLIVVIATLAAYFLAPRTFPRSTSLLAPLPVFAALVAFRSYAGARAARSRLLERRIVLLGIDPTTRDLARLLAREHRPVPYVPVAFGADIEASELEGLRVIGEVAQLRAHVRALGAQEIVVAARGTLSLDAQRALALCAQDGITIVDARQLHEQITARVLLDDADARLLMSEHATLYATVKRLGDIASTAALMVVLLPVYAVIALAILIDDGRPILFRQTRLGLRGAPFTIHKFRSMRRHAEADGPRYAVRDDPRATRIGRLLRPSGLDELPQLWDVFRGAMSLIGPRPERPEHVTGLARRVPLYSARHQVRPGMVGWAEVHVPHASTDEDHIARLEYDLYYVKHAGPLLDANIALRTISLMFGGRR